MLNQSSETSSGPTDRDPPQDAPPQFHAQLDEQAFPEARDAWHTLLRPLFDIQIEAGSSGFSGELQSTHLGDSLIARCTSSSATHFRRGALDIRRGHLDHLLIQFYTDGGVQGEYGKRTVNAAAGSVSLLDLGQALDSRAPAFSNITLIVPRDRLPASLRSRKLHGAVLDPGHGATSLLASHLSQLMKSAATLTGEEMTASVNASLILLAGSLSKLSDSNEDAQQTVREGMRRLVRRHIERHLTSETLSPEQIAAAMNLSRASLYRLFQGDGGVNAYIQGRRLDSCFDELLLFAGSRLGVAELAYRYGFSSESAFSRAFRRRFGLSPREVRACSQQARERDDIGTKASGNADTVQAWLADIQGTKAEPAKSVT